MKPAVYYRRSLAPIEEVEAIRKYFEVSADTMASVPGCLVAGRYSVLPFYADIQRELALHGSRLLNTYSQHAYIAGFDWYHDLEGMTPKTWFRLADVDRQAGPYVLKGRTNSRKHDWRTHMYAESFQDAVDVAHRLGQDSLIGEQDIVIRRYEELKSVGTALNGMPFGNEHRFFFLNEEMLSYGWYWTSADDRGSIDAEGIALACKAAALVTPHAPFVAIDVAEKAAGGWTVIEVNDGQMAGLSDNDPDQFYSSLSAAMGRLISSEPKG
jgi:hypothetical protein